MEKVINLKTKSSSLAIFKNIVIGYLKNYKKGKLKLTLENNEVLTFGDESMTWEADIKVTSENFYKKVVLSGDIGFSESFMDGDWTTKDLKKVFNWAILNLEDSGIISGKKNKNYQINLMSFTNKLRHLLNANTLKGSQKNISYHYDLSNQFYELMLDPTMTYSCGYFEQTKDLQTAQIKKYELIANSLGIKDGDSVLEIGCGWGGFARYINSKYNEITYKGVTISKEQLEYAKNSLKGVDKKDNYIEFNFEDYRSTTGKYDKIVSIEMIEAVGHENYPEYFNQINSLLKSNGVATIQAITSPDSRYEQIRKGTDFIQKHIFPGSLLPSIRAITNACIDNELHIFEIKDIGLHYAKTLSLWNTRFEDNWKEIEELGFNQVFKRKWHYYLKYCEAAFETRNISTQQITFIKPNNTHHNLLED